MLTKDLNIIYLNESQNRGKHIIWNKAVSLSQGDYFIPADCDDSFINETLEFYNNKLNTLNQEILNNISGINVCCYNPLDTKIIGDTYPYDGIISDNIELTYKYKIKGEHWGTIKTTLLKQFKFPNIKGHFYNESYIWYSLAISGYKVICYNIPLRGYYIETSSLTHNTKYKFNREIIIMNLHYIFWAIRKAARTIYKYNPKIYFDYSYKLIKLFAKLILSFSPIK